MKEDKGGHKIVIKSEKEKKFGNAKAMFAVFVMVASALIVSGSGWGYGNDTEPRYRLVWQIGDVETSLFSSPWNEFGIIKATPYKINFRVGQSYSFFPVKTAPFCQGYPNKINILFCTDLATEGLFVFRYSPGYTSCEKIEVYLDGALLDTFYDIGGYNEDNFCTFKMVTHSIKIPCNPVDEKHHVLTILHKGGDGAFWDYIQLWIKDYGTSTTLCKCLEDKSYENCNYCCYNGCCYYVPGYGSQPIASNNYYGCKQPETGYIPPSFDVP